jgi:hypothetical protein
MERDNSFCSLGFFSVSLEHSTNNRMVFAVIRQDIQQATDFVHVLLSETIIGRRDRRRADDGQSG